MQETIQLGAAPFVMGWSKGPAGWDASMAASASAAGAASCSMTPQGLVWHQFPTLLNTPGAVGIYCASPAGAGPAPAARAAASTAETLGGLACDAPVFGQPGQPNQPGQPGSAASGATLQRRMRRQRATRLAREGAVGAAGLRAREPRSAGAGEPEGDAESGEARWAAEDEAPQCAALQGDLEAGGERRAAALARLRGTVARRSFEAAGCRAVQAAFEHCTSAEVQELVAELHGHVQRACESPHANFVVQKIVEVLPAEVSSFVAEELCSFASSGVRHKFGCRVFCRLIEHAGMHPATERLIEQVASEASELCRHEFGHHVISHIIEHGQLHHRRLAVGAIVGPQLVRHARNRYGRFVLEVIFTYDSPEGGRAIVAWLRAAGGCAAELAAHQFGQTVVSAALRSGLPEAAALAAGLSAAAPRLREGKYGQRVLQDLERFSPRPAAPAAAALPAAAAAA